nr:YfbM family protein [uncultured Sphingomonas sp.]
MGMVFALRRATDEQIDALLARPLLIEDFLYNEPRVAAVAKTGLMEKLISTFGFASQNSTISGEREEGDEIDLDKAWHGLHFTLTGSGWATGAPLSFLVEEWPEIGDVDVGYGPAKAIRAVDVARFNDALAGFTAMDLRAGYRPQTMLEQELYLADFFAENPEEGIEYIEHWLTELRTFIAGCVARNAGVVSYIC